jgi:hypothetical protein
LTDILEGDAEPSETPLRIFLHSARDTNTTRFCQRLQSGRHVHTVTVDASALNDISDVNPHPEVYSPICRNFRIPLGHSALDLYGTTQGVHGTDEQDQQAVASCPYDPTAVFFNLGFNELSKVSVQLGQRAFVIVADLRLGRRVVGTGVGVG